MRVTLNRRALRGWAKRHHRRVAFRARFAEAAAIDARALCMRTARAWQHAARTLAEHRVIIHAQRRRQQRRAAAQAVHTWAAYTTHCSLASAAWASAQQRATVTCVAIWRQLAAAAASFEQRWRRAVRHRYRWLLGMVVLAWRALLARRHARWGIVLGIAPRARTANVEHGRRLARRISLRTGAEHRLHKRRRSRALRQWHERAVPAAAAAAAATNFAAERRKIRALPRWRHGVSFALERRLACDAAARLHGRVLGLKTVIAWTGYVALRQRRRAIKAARLEVSRRSDEKPRLASTPTP